MLNNIKSHLNGRVISLIPFSEKHIPSLKKAGSTPSIFRFNMAPNQSLETYLSSYFTTMQKQSQNPKHHIYLVQKNEDKAICGTTQFYDISPENKKCAIGYTWYSPNMWGSAVNPEVKLLLLTHAFEELKLNRVEFHVDSENERSIGAMTKLGATQEGILRKHKIVRGGFARDTVLFSVILDEWADIKEGLVNRLDPFS